MPLSHIAKNEPKTQFHLKLPFLLHDAYVPTKVKKCGNHGRNMSQSNLFETMSAFVFLALAQGLAFLVFIVEWLSRRDS